MSESGKTAFHTRLNNHRKDIKNPIEACKYFKNWNHVFYKYVEFILIKQLNNIKNISTAVLNQRLKDRDN